ncbi:hypothetical protein FRACA_540007 [Frankia canadensis]|uniref:Uncharacterized protein n=1 Tax=Frankia canadensis TaxID=1836972 RepID=A0A2I2KYS8_9ACTN|nr:hypothetical protein FRACA_540007 [Frankia canadensis]SOU58111.1 hypothetical protein FRACA_540007 [Frankia canadensis]
MIEVLTALVQVSPSDCGRSTKPCGLKRFRCRRPLGVMWVATTLSDGRLLRAISLRPCEQPHRVTRCPSDRFVYVATASVEEALARFCLDLPRQRRILRAPASVDRLARLAQDLAALRRGEPPGEILTRWGYSSPAGEEDPDPSRTSLPPPVDAGHRRVTGLYVCPRGACARVAYREAGAALPNCDIHERSLRFVADR